MPTQLDMFTPPPMRFEDLRDDQPIFSMTTRARAEDGGEKHE